MFTPRQIGLIVTAYTGIGCCNFNEFHAYAENLLNRPILTHEFGDGAVWNELKEKTRAEFLKLAEWCSKAGGSTYVGEGSKE